VKIGKYYRFLIRCRFPCERFWSKSGPLLFLAI
jgi:hypothetical protein